MVVFNIAINQMPKRLQRKFVIASLSETKIQLSRQQVEYDISHVCKVVSLIYLLMQHVDQGKMISRFSTDKIFIELFARITPP